MQRPRGPNTFDQTEQSYNHPPHLNPLQMTDERLHTLLDFFEHSCNAIISRQQQTDKALEVIQNFIALANNRQANPGAISVTIPSITISPSRLWAQVRISYKAL
jgi:hypothetical protein